MTLEELTAAVADGFMSQNTARLYAWGYPDEAFDSLLGDQRRRADVLARADTRLDVLQELCKSLPSDDGLADVS